MSASQTSLQPAVRRASTPRVDSPPRTHTRRNLVVHPNRGYRITRPTRSCPHYIALATLVVIFICSLYFAITNWRGIERDAATPNVWKKRKCTVKSKVQTERKRPLSEFHRVFVNVTVSGRVSKVTKAYYGPSESKLPDLSEEEAQKRANQLNEQIRIGTELNCWVADADSDNPKVSLTAITTSASVYLAWTGTFLAAVVGVVIITVFSNSTHGPLGVSYLREPLVMAPPVAKSVHLTERQALRICNKFAQDIRAQSCDADWTCSICLDDDYSTDLIKTVVLPCDHRFHTLCIKRWLWKGKGECPLCKWDARKFIDKEKKADRERFASAAEFTTEAATDSSTYGSSGMLHELGTQRNPPAAAQPSSNGGANASQDVSHITIDTVMLETASNGAAATEHTSNMTTDNRDTATDSSRSTHYPSSRPPRPP
ncbi:hypothetical protein BWQ96_05133 [Gracilariopsis chorda]|uniref:RING-type domain-containing protein n=1 Tax=Gracilariopsis chorda TaxID=448386 RepID=A0A2V3ISL3_9FLOR|nr:hypothetical protein BWQ96_05133 [Gracilariopsis chorda]|eukprot:PXF45094.1 hypothetical protein BWQ96_05133 [Gracilariopsis chorda]